MYIMIQVCSYCEISGKMRQYPEVCFATTHFAGFCVNVCYLSGITKCKTAYFFIHFVEYYP